MAGSHVCSLGDHNCNNLKQDTSTRDHIGITAARHRVNLITAAMFNGQPPNIYVPGRRAGNTSAPTTSTSAVAVMAGTDIEGTANHLRELQETESNTVKCVPNYRNRLKHIIQFWKVHYSEYYDEVVFDLTPAQKSDKRRYHTATQDLRFELLNPLMMKLFLSGHAKTTEGGKHYSFVHARKYHGTVLYCAKLAGKNLTQ